MIFHSGDKRLEKKKLLQVTKWLSDPNEVMFATGLLDRDKIPWMISCTGSRYALFRETFK